MMKNIVIFSVFVEWRYSWGAVKVFCSSQCWSCANTDSVTRYSMANHFLCSCVAWLRLWYGPESAIKTIIINIIIIIIKMTTIATKTEWKSMWNQCSTAIVQTGKLCMSIRTLDFRQIVPWGITYLKCCSKNSYKNFDNNRKPRWEQESNL